MDTLEMKEVEAAIEGILFASGEPVAVDRICMAMDMDRPTVELVLQKLTDCVSKKIRYEKGLLDTLEVYPNSRIGGLLCMVQQLH